MGRINQRIRAFRKIKGYTQLELANKIDISAAILGAIERSEREPDIAILEQICEALEIEMDELKNNK